MRFGDPILLLLLLALPLAAGLWLWLERRRSRYAVRFTNMEVLASVAGRERRWRSWVPPLLLALAFAAALLAIARPQVRSSTHVQNASVVLALDVSGSMRSTDVYPSRLEAAIGAIEAFLKVLPSQYRVGLITFAAEPFVAAPLTHDRSLVLGSLTQGPGIGVGTAIGDAVGRAVEMLAPTSGEGTATGAQKAGRPLNAILLLSDGAQRGGDLQPLQGAARARSYGIPVYTVALGRTDGARPDTSQGQGGPGGFQGGGGGFGGFGGNMAPDPATLRAIAKATGGTSFATADADKLRKVYEHLASTIGRAPGWREIGDVLLGIAAALALAAGVLSLRWVHRLP